MKYSLKGKIIVSGFVGESLYSKSVILIIEHNENCTIGVVLNKKKEYDIHKILKKSGFEIFKKICDGVDIYVGGPNEIWNIYLLHDDETISQNDLKICDGLYISYSVDHAQHILQKNKFLSTNKKHFKVFAGDCVWKKGELENEIAQGKWYVFDYDKDILFNDGDNLYTSIENKYKIKTDEYIEIKGKS